MSKRAIAIVAAVVVVAAIAFGGSGNSGASSSGTVPANTSASSASASVEVATVFGDPEVVNVMNGTGDRSIGTSANFRAAKADCTPENLATWYGQYVKDSKDNWCVIVFTDDERHGVYANAGMVQVGVGLDEQDDGSYMLCDDAGSTFYVYNSNTGELEEKK